MFRCRSGRARVAQERARDAAGDTATRGEPPPKVHPHCDLVTCGVALAVVGASARELARRAMREM